jgi:hypothetical protein
VQYDDGPQVWFALQYLEQQSVFAAHGLPSVLHVALSGAHVPPEQLPPQHSALPLHAAPSAVHCCAEHLPLMQLTVQQSVFAMHDAPEAAHTGPPEPPEPPEPVASGDVPPFFL